MDKIDEIYKKALLQIRKQAEKLGVLKIKDKASSLLCKTLFET